MNPQDLIATLKSASVGELAQIRSLLRVPDAIYGQCRMDELPRNLGEIWNRTEQRVSVNHDKPSTQ